MYQWVAADLLTGRIIDRLPGFEPAWPLDRVLSDATTTSGTLNLTDKTPDSWQRCVWPGGSLLACYDDRVDVQPIVWCGEIEEIEKNGADDTVAVNLTSFEGYFDAAYVGDVTYPTTMARNDIIAAVINTWFKAATGVNYLQLDYAPGVGTKPTADLILQNSDNATVKDRLDQIVGQLGGEYMVTWAWSTDRLSIVPTLHFGDRIGTPATTSSNTYLPTGPRVRFTLPGPVTAITQGIQYGKDTGARKVVAYSSGEGDSTPYSPPQLGPVDGRPLREFRWSPAPSISPEALTQYAKQAVPIVSSGKQPIALTVSMENPTGRQLGVDWDLGDDVAYEVKSSYTNDQGKTVSVRAFPQGLSGVGRVTQISIDGSADTVTPSLADKTVYVQGGS